MDSDSTANPPNAMPYPRPTQESRPLDILKRRYTAEYDMALALGGAGAALVGRYGIEVEAVVTSGRDTSKAPAAPARRAGASAIVIGRSSAGRLSRLLRGPEPARTLLDRASCTLIAVRD